MQSDELWAFHVPVSLLGLEHQVNAVGQATIQQLDQFRTLLFREAILCLVHEVYFLLIGSVCNVVSLVPV